MLLLHLRLFGCILVLAVPSSVNALGVTANGVGKVHMQILIRMLLNYVFAGLAVNKVVRV